jgi:tetratricopeptide (TPR) repeat protein
MKKIVLLLSLLILNSMSLLVAQDDVNFLAGERAYNAGSYKLATEYYNKYIKTFEAKLPDYLDKVKSYDTSTKFEQSSLFPDFSIKHEWAVVYYKKGMANLNNSEFVQAGKDFDLAIQIDSKYAEPYLQKGLLVKGKGKNEACPYICKARLLSDTMKAAKQAYRENFCWMCGIEYFTKGKTETDLRQFTEALQNLNKAILFCHDSGNYYAYRGIAYEGLGKLDSALADYSLAIKMDSTKYAGYYRRALTYEAAQKYKEAFADLTKVLILNPKFADAYKHQAADCENLGMNEAALYDYQQLIRLKPSEGISWYKLGLRKKNMGEDACDYFQKAVDLGCEDAQSYADECAKEAARKALK